MKIALVGAGSSVGRFLLKTMPEIFIGIYRSPKALSQLCDLDTAGLITCASTTQDMISVFKEVDAVVTLINDENPAAALASLKQVLSACKAAGVRQLIHMSSASVFGANITGSNDFSRGGPVLSWNTYAVGKQWQENAIAAATSLPSSTIILRPGLIWGPGMAWLHVPASEVVRGDAWVVDRNAPCNLVNINFLAFAISELVRMKPEGLTYLNIRDKKTYTWADYYERIAFHLNHKLFLQEIGSVGHLPWKSQPGRLRSTFPLGLCWAILPKPVKYLVKRFIKVVMPTERPGLVTVKTQASLPVISREVWELKTTNILPSVDPLTLVLQKNYVRTPEQDWSDVIELRDWIFV